MLLRTGKHNVVCPVDSTVAESILFLLRANTRDFYLKQFNKLFKETFKKKKQHTVSCYYGNGKNACDLNFTF